MTTNGPGRRLALLTAQAFALGITLAWITIPANTIFLERFGSGLLPVTYIGAAATGALASVVLGRSLRRRSIAAVAVRVFTATSIGLAAGWLLLWGGAEWMSFVLLVLLPVALPVGFMFVVGQAGLLLDVRVLKAMYPRVVAGFALGFTIGGLAGAPVLDLLGGTEQLLAAASVTAAALLALVMVTVRMFGPELAVLDAEEADGQQVAMRDLLSDRYIVLIMAFQVLSAVESQWLDFLVYDHAARRYPNSDDLAEFVGRFSAIAYGADILFLVLCAGLLMRRFGLRFGLRANSVVVFAMVTAIVLASIAQGSGATLVFVLVVASRVSDITLSDGASRTSLSAAYQAVPNALRPPAQTLVESLAVPLAIGFSGIVLVILRATVGTSGLWLPVLVIIVLAAWVACSVILYLDYGRSLLANLRHRLLEPAELVDGTGFTDEIVDRLLGSDDPRDVRLGLTALTGRVDPGAIERLDRLARAGVAGVQPQILDQLAELLPGRAIEVARATLTDERPWMRIAALDLLADHGDAADAAAAQTFVDDADPDVLLAAARVVSMHGGAAMASRIGELVPLLAASHLVGDRQLACGLLRVCEPAPWIDRDPLGTLLTDDDVAVSVSALAAFRWSEDARWAATVNGLLDRREVAAAAITVLSAGGRAALDLGEPVLSGAAPGQARQRHLWARVCRDMGGPDAAAVLERHVLHHDRDVGLAATRALASIDAPPDDHRRNELTTELLAADLAHAERLLGHLVALADLPQAAALRTALNDELALLRDRVIAALSLRFGTEAGSRLDFQLRQPNPRVHAIALEWLEVELPAADRRILPVLDPSLDDSARFAAMSHRRGGHDRQSDILRDLVEDRDAVWRRPWVSACAMFAAGHLDVVDVRDLDISAHVDAGEVHDVLHETQSRLANRP